MSQRTIGVAMVKDEADIIDSTLRLMAHQVDGLLVADNMSTDGTVDILRRLSETIDMPMKVVLDKEVGYNQSAKMTALARIARKDMGADWIVPFDADEVWVPNLHSTLAEINRHIDPQAETVPANLFDYVASGLDDAREKDPVRRLCWRRTYAAELPKVMCRWRNGLTIGMGNHDATYNRKDPVSTEPMITIYHYPYRSAEQVVRKIRNGARAYEATKLPDHFGAHWRQWGQILELEGEDAIVELFRKWHWREDPTKPFEIDGEPQPALIYDPVKR